MERPTLQRDQTLVDQFGTAVDQSCRLRSILQSARGNTIEIRFIGLPEVGRVGVGKRTLVAHPRHGSRRIEPTRKRDADPLTNG